jgi:SAM-dependent methyltransferase
MGTEPEYHFYRELAEWWPLISPTEDYAEESAYVGSLLDEPDIKTVLELGSGGGHVAFYLKPRFEMTLVDLSEQMLDMSRRLNPECAHFQGDMRTVRLDRQFDAVLVHDAIDYMATEDDLRQAMKTAFVHCRPGGVALLIPDHITENFQPGTDHGGSDADDGRGVRFLEWTTDPEPSDTSISTDYTFVLRGRDGRTRLVHETHVTGLFPRQTWLRLLADVGFEAEALIEETTEDRTPRELYRGRRPLDAN